MITEKPEVEYFAEVEEVMLATTEVARLAVWLAKSIDDLDRHIDNLRGVAEGLKPDLSEYICQLQSTIETLQELEQ